MEKHQIHVIVIGAGYAGLLAAVRMAMKNKSQTVKITLINPSEAFVERPRLHQFAANQPIKPRPIEDVLKGTGVQFVRASVTGVDMDRKEVAVQAEESGIQHLAYDYLLITSGSTVERDSVPGVRQYAYTLNPAGPRSAQDLKSLLPELNRKNGSLVVVGGGPTGIEAAAEFAESYPQLSVTLVTEGKLGAWLGGGIQAHIQNALPRLGVSVREQTAVKLVEQNALITGKGESIGFDVCLWAGGFVAASLGKEVGLPVNVRGQVLIDATMRSVSNPWIYAAGDSAQLAVAGRMPIRMAAYTAVITGAHAADCLWNVINGRQAKPLNFAYLGQGIALGRHDAVDFNNYPDDKPKWPVITGQAGVVGREFFVNLVADFSWIERSAPGLHFWPVPIKPAGKITVRKEKRQAEVRG